MAYFRCIGGGNGSNQGFVVGNVTRIIEGKWDGTGSTTYTFDKDIDDCLIFLTYTRETNLTDSRYTLTLASGSYEVLEDTEEVVGSTTRTRTVCLHVKEIKANDTLYMYNFGDQRNADLCEIVETQNILKGTSTPSSSQGSNGQIYLKYSEYAYSSFMNGTIIVRENLNDATDIKLFVVGLTKDANAVAITDNDLLAYLNDIQSGYLKGCASYDTASSDTQTGIFSIGNWGSGMAINTYTIGWSAYKAGTFYGMLDLNESPVQAVGVPNYQHNGNPICNTNDTSLIISAYAKVGGVWQDLIGTDIDDISTSGGEVEYTISAGSVITTDTATATLTSGKYYLFATVYGGVGFSDADVKVGNTEPIYTSSGIGRTGCIIKATGNTVTYNRYGSVSDNEYVELDTTNNLDIIAVDSSWSSGSSASVINGKFYFLALGDGETGNVVGADVLVEHELTDTVSNGTRFLIVKATSTTLTLDSGNSFYYRQIGLAV